jgi:hypothetical protein
MAGRSPETVRKEIETERVALEGAVHSLRSEAVHDAKTKLPIVVAGAAAVGVLVLMLKRRVSRRAEPEKTARARFPFR